MEFVQSFSNMKRTNLLNRDLSALVARLGHMDEITVCDAGLPCPPGVEVIDLSITPGTPSLWVVLDALAEELVIEGAVFAKEASDTLVGRFDRVLAKWAEATDVPIETHRPSHDDFKRRTAMSRAIIRTGEVTPYANIILISGVAF